MAMLDWLVTISNITLLILSIIHAIRKTNSEPETTETAAKLLAVFLTVATFAWLMSIQQYYILHIITGQTIIKNDNSSMSVKYFKENILNTLPNQTWNGVAKITLKQFIDNNEKNDYYYETEGIYYPSSHSIKLKVMQIEDMRKNMAHEAAHWYWFNKLTNTQQKEWAQLYTKTQKFSSDYAKTSEREDFAETTSYIIAQHQVTTDQEKIDFITKNYLKPLNLTEELGKEKK